eukprot:CAMPEP_0114546776 /NCGR_PEP_ID=MMETSP0114-20121206/4111_1 /TAXON_ID=31324 /ORGANISM="Goniomonas sp, Strain m" /LENGTH=110 /DNA_ID=CAMNT_0001731287 /DNA_START=106 /DNA_END=438 /DNA_ORIENTATION=-
MFDPDAGLLQMLDLEGALEKSQVQRSPRDEEHLPWNVWQQHESILTEATRCKGRKRHQECNLTACHKDVCLIIDNRCSHIGTWELQHVRWRQQHYVLMHNSSTCLVNSGT